MERHLEDFLRHVSRNENPDDIWENCVQFFGGYGIETVYFWFGNAEEDIFWKTTVPPSWNAHYLENQYYQDDKVYNQAFTTTTPFYYGLEVDNDWIERHPRFERMLNEIADFGLNHGLIVPVASLDPKRGGGINLGTGGGIETLDRIVANRTEQVMLAAHCAHLRLNTLFGSRPREAQPALSVREREVLLWLAKGLRVDAIADKMHVKPVTVTLHIQKARRKLGARTRDQALSLAIMKGLIDP